MSKIFKKLQQVVENTYKKLYEQDHVMPVVIETGILVGKVLIISRGPVKNLSINGDIIYKNICLNAAAIRLANVLTKYGKNMTCDRIYQADQEYGKWLNESQILRNKYQKARREGRNDQADVYLAKYCTARDRAKYYHAQVLALVSN